MNYPHPTIEYQIEFIESMIKDKARALFAAEPAGIAADELRHQILTLDNIKETLQRVKARRDAS